MTQPHNVFILILVLASITLPAEGEEEETTATTSPFMQVGQVIPDVLGDAATTATKAASEFLPDILQSTMGPVAGEQVCNTTAFMIHLDNCMTAERVSRWIKIAKPFIRLMAKAEIPAKKNNRS